MLGKLPQTETGEWEDEKGNFENKSVLKPVKSNRKTTIVLKKLASNNRYSQLIFFG